MMSTGANINREYYKQKLSCTDDQLDELIEIYLGFLASGISASFDDLVNGINRVIKPTADDIKWAVNVLDEIENTVP